MHDRGHHVGDLPATFAEYLAQICLLCGPQSHNPDQTGMTVLESLIWAHAGRSRHPA